MLSMSIRVSVQAPLTGPPSMTERDLRLGRATPAYGAGSSPKPGVVLVVPRTVAVSSSRVVKVPSQSVDPAPQAGPGRSDIGKIVAPLGALSRVVTSPSPGPLARSLTLTSSIRRPLSPVTLIVVLATP